LWFEPTLSRWQYDIDKILGSKISDNVVEHLSRRITSLSEPLQEILKIAACVGNQFNSDIITKVTEQDEDTFHYFDLAENSGLIVNQTQTPSKENTSCRYYAFSHDRIQQTVWELISRQQLQKIHLKIGRCMLEQDAQNEKDYLLQTVDHLNTALPLIESKEERLRLGEINFKAGLESKKTGDFELALSYIQTAMNLFLDAFDDKRLLSTALIRERAECEHLCGNNDQAKEFYEQAIEIVCSSMEKAHIYELMIQFYTDLAQFDEAYSISRSAMQLFEITLPAQFNPLVFVTDYTQLSIQLRKFTISELLNLPQATGPYMNTIIRILSATLKVAYQIKPELCVAISVKLLRLCLTYGNTREAVVGYMVFGVIFQGAVKGNHPLSYEYGQLSLALLDKYDNDRQRAEVNFVYGYFANSWVHPASDSEQYWNTAYKTGLETGDWFHTSCACCSIIQNMFMRGVPLDTVVDEAKHFLPTVQRIGGHEQSGAIQTVIQAIQNLRGQTENSISFTNTAFDETVFVESLNNYGSRHFAHYYFINKMQCLYLQGQYPLALELSHRSKGYLKDSAGMLHSVEHHFYTALILAKLHPQANKMQCYRWLKIMKSTEQKLIAWSEQCPANFLSRRYLVSGEICRIQGQNIEALTYYENANQAGDQYGHLHIQAMANELSAHLCDFIGQSRTATFYRNEAVSYYQHWGANAYQQRIATEKGITFSSDSYNALAYDEAEKTLVNEIDLLDVATLIKSAEVIAKQRRLPELLQTLISIVIENAGAQRGVLLLKEHNGLVIQAEATLEENDISVLQNISILDYQKVPHSIINYVFRTQESVVIDNTKSNSIFSQDDDVINRQILSVLCAPLIMHGEIKGIIYLENNVAGSRYFCESLFWASQPKQAAKT
jgi:tetratricopeptide (TPR) repeat protein